MPRHFVLAVLVLLLAPGIAQAHKKTAHKSHHRTAVAANGRAARNAAAGNAQDAEPASNPVPLSWLLIILTSVVADAFVTSPPGEYQPALTGSRKKGCHWKPQAHFSIG